MQRDFDSLEEWSHKTSSSVTRPSARSSTWWVRANPNINTGWRMKELRAEKDLSVLTNEKPLNWRSGLSILIWWMMSMSTATGRWLGNLLRSLLIQPILWFYNLLSLWLYLQVQNKVCIAAQCLLNTCELWK